MQAQPSLTLTLMDSEVGPNLACLSCAAPEVISASRKRYDGRQADVWSCGVMMYVMLFHSYPFERPGDPPGPRGFAKVRLTGPPCDVSPPFEEPDAHRVTDRAL